MRVVRTRVVKGMEGTDKGRVVFSESDPGAFKVNPVF